MCFRSAMMIIGCFLRQVPFEIYMVVFCPSQTLVHEFTLQILLQLRSVNLFIQRWKKTKGKIFMQVPTKQVTHHNTFLLQLSEGARLAKVVSNCTFSKYKIFTLFQVTVFSNNPIFKPKTKNSKGKLYQMGTLGNKPVHHAFYFCSCFINATFLIPRGCNHPYRLSYKHHNISATLYASAVQESSFHSFVFVSIVHQVAAVKPSLNACDNVIGLLVRIAKLE